MYRNGRSSVIRQVNKLNPKAQQAAAGSSGGKKLLSNNVLEAINVPVKRFGINTANFSTMATSTDNNQQPKVVIICEDDKRSADICVKLQEKGVPHEVLFLDKASLSLEDLPRLLSPNNVYYCRVSPSSFLRSHESAPTFAKIVMKYLADNVPRENILNTAQALELEVSKAAQVMQLKKFGIRTPKTFVCMTRKDVVATIEKHYIDDENTRLVVKPNLGGSGEGVQILANGKLGLGQLKSSANTTKMNSADGLYILQEYTTGPGAPLQLDKTGKSYHMQQWAYRLEIIDQKPQYSLKMDSTSKVALCPCDQNKTTTKDGQPAFQVVTDPMRQIDGLASADVWNDFVAKCVEMTKQSGIDICAVEFKIDARDGIPTVHDLNVNTNYNKQAEERAGVVSAYDLLAEALKNRLAKVSGSAL